MSSIRHDGRLALSAVSQHPYTIVFPFPAAQEQRLGLDEEDYRRRMEEHERISRAETAGVQLVLNVSGGLPATDDRPKWHGPQTQGKILGWIADNHFIQSGTLNPGREVGLVLGVGDALWLVAVAELARGTLGAEGRWGVLTRGETPLGIEEERRARDDALELRAGGAVLATPGGAPKAQA